MSKQVSFSATICALTMALFAATISFGDHMVPAAEHGGTTPVFSAGLMAR